MAKKALPTATEVISAPTENDSQLKEKESPLAALVNDAQYASLAPRPDVKHVQFHAGIDAMGSSLSVSNRQADLFLELNGVRIVGKTDKNKGKKFFVPFTNIRGVTLL